MDFFFFLLSFEYGNTWREKGISSSPLYLISKINTGNQKFQNENEDEDEVLQIYMTERTEKEQKCVTRDLCASAANKEVHQFSLDLLVAKCNFKHETKQCLS
jgi:hypothetical protein